MQRHRTPCRRSQEEARRACIRASHRACGRALRVVRPARPELRKTEHDQEQQAAIPGPLPFVWIEASRIQLRKKHRPGFLSESGATGSVKLMFYANGQLLERMDDAGIDGGDGSLVIMAFEGQPCHRSPCSSRHRRRGTYAWRADIRSRRRRRSAERPEQPCSGLRHPCSRRGPWPYRRRRNASTNGKTEAVKLASILLVVNLLDTKVGILEVLRGDVELATPKS